MEEILKQEPVKENDIHELHALLVTNENEKVRQFAKDFSIVSLAEELNSLSENETVLFFSIVQDYDKLGEIFAYLLFRHKIAVAEELDSKRFSLLLANVPNDDLVDFLTDLNKNRREKILALIPARRRKILGSLARFGDDTIGSIMTTEYLAVSPEKTVKEVLDLIRTVGKDQETVRTIFVTDEGNHLLGIQSLEELMFCKEDEKIGDVMSKDFPSISPISDREEATRICRQFDLPVLPVVSRNNDLLGIITFDDVLDVIEEENTEDVLKQAAIAPGKTPYLETRSFRLARSYAIWLVILLVINTFSGMVISSFENALLTFPVLVSFIPALGDSCGDAGDQTSSMVTRSIATGELNSKNWFKAVGKEFLAGIITALIVAVFNFAWVLLELNTPILNITSEMEQTFITLFGSILNGQLVIAAIVSVSFFFGIAVAKLLASVLPFLAKALHLDPAVMSGPLIASIMDILTLLLYFSVSMAIIDGIDPGTIEPFVALL